MINNNNVKQLCLELIALHYFMVHNYDFRSDVMIGMSQNSIGHLLCCFQDAGYITEAELDILDNQIITHV